MSEAVTVPSLMMMTSTVSEESLARDTHTDRHTPHTDRQSRFYLKSCKVTYDFANKNTSCELGNLLTTTPLVMQKHA